MDEGRVGVSTAVIKRPARRPAPEIPTGELAVDPPPEIPQATGRRWQQAMMVLPMLGGSVAMAMMFGRGGGGAYSYVVGGLFGISSLGMLATSFGSNGSPKKAEMMAARREYLRHLSGLRRRVRDTASAQRVGLFYRHPDPASSGRRPAATGSGSAGPADPDFGVVRIAVGPQTLATPLVPPVTRPLEDLEPMTAGALRRFLDAYSVVPDLPVAVSLRGFARVFLRGARDRRDGAASLTRARARPARRLPRPGRPAHRGLRRAGAPGRVGVGQVAAARLHPTRTDALGPVRLVASAGADAGGAARRRARQPAPVQPGRRRRATARTWSSCSTAATWPARPPQPRRRRRRGDRARPRRAAAAAARPVAAGAASVPAPAARALHTYAMDHAARGRHAPTG